ncbi:ribosome-binding factor A [Mycoplasma testudineum]|uniref:Ribosome-binding factor A n=1 Tax=Mycoplasma testudineum TaxID=244584 RepID=A0A4R6IC49_9MOLU|nr:30S ribosome-binding factor RbfA [Mycoplasma testudineum]OYD26525.1 ribosome-binding factor A [Mycoplasma testudineum]TDO19137.1 ribosome-binding factor A [Mycoplasma testudineum]
MNKIQLQKKEKELMLNLSRIINDQVYKLKDTLVTVRDLRLSPSLDQAIVYVTFLDHENVNLEKLNSVKGFLKTELSQILPWRKIPNLIFKIDEVAKSAERIDRILDEIKKAE